MENKKGVEVEVHKGLINLHIWFNKHKDNPQYVIHENNLHHVLNFLKCLSKTEVLVFDPEIDAHRIIHPDYLYVLEDVVRYNDIKDFVNYQLELNLNESV